MEENRQVAKNRTQIRTMELKDYEGQLWVVTDPQMKEQLIRHEYLPTGTRLMYPRSWGKRMAATYFLEHLMDDQTRIANGANARLQRLQECLDKVNEWDDTEK